MESIRLFMCALLLSPTVALAQAEEAVEEEAAVVEEAAPAEEAAPTEEVAAEEAPAEEPAEESADAGGPLGGHQLDLFFVPTVEVDSQVGSTAIVGERGDGFGLRGLFRMGRHYAVSAEYQGLKYGDDDQIEVTESRVGLGFVGDDDDGGFFGLFAEYDVFNSDELGDVDGYSIHGRLSGQRLEWLGFYGDLAYLQLQNDAEDVSGNELLLGVVFKVGKFGFFVDGRRSSYEGKDSGVNSAQTSVRTGVRFDFAP